MGQMIDRASRKPNKSNAEWRALLIARMLHPERGSYCAMCEGSNPHRLPEYALDRQQGVRQWAVARKMAEVGEVVVAAGSFDTFRVCLIAGPKFPIKDRAPL